MAYKYMVQLGGEISGVTKGSRHLVPVVAEDDRMAFEAVRWMAWRLAGVRIEDRDVVAIKRGREA